jgi:membrane associated rhomboid family serine protease
MNFMGIYNREYYRDSPQYPRFSPAEWQGWQIVMLISILVFVLQVLTFQRTAFGGYSEVTYWLSLRSTEFLQGQIWRIITYAFCHDENNIWHILFNMLGLYFFGREIEQRVGRTEFIAFYILAAVIAGLGEILLAIFTSFQSNAVGASGSGMAILILFAYWYPTALLNLYFIFTKFFSKQFSKLFNFKCL